MRLKERWTVSQPKSGCQQSNQLEGTDFISWILLTAIAEDIFRVALVVIKDPRVFTFRQCLIQVQVIHSY